MSIVALSLLLSNKNDKSIKGTLVLSSTGNVQFDFAAQSYQLLPNSRFSFIGFWLVMMPSNTRLIPSQEMKKSIPKKLFIFRDSVNAQDYSRIANVLKQL